MSVISNNSNWCPEKSLTYVGTNTIPSPWKYSSISSDDSFEILSANIAQTMWNIDDNTVIDLGDGVTMKGKELKTCLKVLRKMAMDHYPEDFI